MSISKHETFKNSLKNTVYKECATEEEFWIVRLLGDYAIQQLIKTQGGKCQIPKKSLNNYSRDKRRIPTVRKFFEKENLIKPFYGTQDFFEFMPDKIEKILAGFSKEPQFSTDGYDLHKRYSSLPAERVLIRDRTVRYKDVTRLEAYYAIYIYLNQKDYDFRVITTTYKKERWQPDKVYHSLKVYPIAQIKELDRNILDAHIYDYVSKNPAEILTETFKKPFEVLTDKVDCLSFEKVTEGLGEVKEKIAKLQKVERELTDLSREYAKRGEDKCLSDILHAGHEYVEEHSPIWINEDGHRLFTATILLKGVPVITEKEGDKDYYA